MGVPLSVVDKDYHPDFVPPSTPRKSKPKRLFDFEPKETPSNDKIKTKEKDNYDTGSSKDDDDLDWL